MKGRVIEYCNDVENSLYVNNESVLRQWLKLICLNDLTDYLIEYLIDNGIDEPAKKLPIWIFETQLKKKLCRHFIGKSEFIDYSVQDAFMYFWERADKLDLQKYNQNKLLNEFYKIARNRTIDYIRKNRTRKKYEINVDDLLKEELKKKSDDVENETEFDFADPNNPAPENKLDVELVFSELKDTERTIYKMKHYEDMTFVEIGDNLDMSEDAVKMRYYRSLRKSYKLFEEKKF